MISFGLFLFFSLISKDKWGILSSIFILTFCLGILRFQAVDVPASSIFESQVGQRVSFSGKIIDEPSVGENNQKITVQTISGKNQIRILLSASLGKDYKYGDEIKFEGVLKKPENFFTDQ